MRKQVVTEFTLGDSNKPAVTAQAEVNAVDLPESLIAPTLSSPASGYVFETEREPTLVWEEVPAASEYELEVSKDPAFHAFTLNDSSR